MGLNNRYKIALIKGDGIGPEVVNEAVRVLNEVAKVSDFELEYKEYLMGGIAYDTVGDPLPDETIEGAKNSDAILFGAIGGQQYDNLPRDKRPESGLLQIRKELNLFSNLRPATVYDELAGESSLKENVVKGTDLLVIRELTGGIYFGTPRGRETKNVEDIGIKVSIQDRISAYDTMVYSAYEIKRIAKVAFEIAAKRGKKVCSVDKANVLESSRLWREVVSSVHEEYEDISLSHMYVDNASMQLVKDPKQFDVILTSNLFGDILSDEASMITGSIGLLPSASIGDKYSLYEPIHGSAPDIANQGIANPIAAIESAAMMLSYSLNEIKASKIINKAVAKALQDGYRTKDISSSTNFCSTKDMGLIIAKNVSRCKD